MGATKKVFKILFSRIFGFIFFLILLAIANYFKENLPVIAKDIIVFFNNSILLLFIIMLLLMIGEIFMVLMFPFNLPAPLFNALGAVFLVEFVFRIFGLLGSFIGLQLPFNLLSLIISIMVFIIVIVVGYIVIFVKAAKKEPKKKEKGWEEIGEEFRLAMLDFAKAIRETFSKKRKKKK